MEEKLAELEGKLLKVAKTTDENTSVMLGGINTIDVRLAMLFLILEDVVCSLPITAVIIKQDGTRKIDLEYYEKRALEEFKSQEAELASVEPATDAEEVATFFGGKS